MTQRTCSAVGCARPHWARGMCSSHYGAWHRKINGRTSNGSKFAIVCEWCGESSLSSRPTGRFCSDACKGKHYSETMRTRCKLPAEHPVMLLIAEARKPKARVKPDRYTWRTERECPACACWFTPLHTPNAICCSPRCAKKMARRRRRAREHNTANDWRWSDFMRVARKFGYCCAYCGERDGQLEPDHVIPLSRGGMDAVSNLLPSCRLCNADKNARTLSEWAEWRAGRGKPPRRTSWTLGDSRYAHLVDAALISPAA